MTLSAASPLVECSDSVGYVGVTVGAYTRCDFRVSVYEETSEGRIVMSESGVTGPTGALPFKNLTVENWSESDPTSGILVSVSPRTGVQAMTGDAWAEEFLRPQLDADVPAPIRELFEVARGACLYGWFFYPLYVLAEEQMFRVADAALAHAHVEAGETGELSFQARVDWAISRGLIAGRDGNRWMAIVDLRNLTSHPLGVSIAPQTDALHTLRLLARCINEIFGKLYGRVPLRLMIDSMIFDKLIEDQRVLRALKELTEEGRVEVLVTHVQHDQLRATPDSQKRRRLLEVAGKVVPTHGVVVGVSGIGEARLADDQAMSVLRGVGERGQGRARRRHMIDALIAATAEKEADLIVTDDQKLRARLRSMDMRVGVWTWERMRTHILASNPR